MTASARPRWQPLIIAFAVWFAHFMACWVAVELWPRQGLANAWAWGLTAVALLALGGFGLHLRRSLARAGRQDLNAWTDRLGLWAVAMASLAIVFTTVPALVFIR